MGDLELQLAAVCEADLCAESSFAPRVNRLRVASPGSVKLSRVLILNEMIKHLNGEISARSCESTADGYSSSFKVTISGKKEGTQPAEVTGRSNGFFCTEEEAIDKAAEDLIYSLMNEFDIEIENLDWLQRDENGSSAVSSRCYTEELKKENMLLRDLVDTFVDGWSYSLQLADSVCNMSGTLCLCVRSALSDAEMDEDANFVVSNSAAFADYTKLVWSEGVRSFRSALAKRQAVYEI